jgi:hypothetical protein
VNLDKRVGDLEKLTLEDKIPHYDPEYTVVAINLPEHIDEELGEKVEPVRYTRLKSNYDKPGLVKIQLRTKEDKIRVLRSKSNLKNSRLLKKVYLRSSLSYVERTMQNNLRELLKEMPNGNKFRLTGNGKLVRNEAESDQREVKDRPRAGPANR